MQAFSIMTSNKRKRSFLTTEANNSDDFIVALPPEITELIVQMLDIVDYHRFSAVCKTWRSVAVAAKQKRRFSLQQLPWLMLSSNDSSKDDHHGFFSLAHGKSLKLKLPEVRGCRCCGSSWGWLIMANEIGDNFLLNPFSRLQIQLPSQTTIALARYPIPHFRDLERWWQGPSYIRKAMLLTPPAISSTTTSGNGINSVAHNCIVVAIYEMKNLAFCRPGDQAWTDFGTGGRLEVCFEDMILFKDQLYAVTADYDLVLIELDPHPKGRKVDMPCPEGHDRIFQWDVELIYLVESCGELLMVVRHCDIPRSNGNIRLRGIPPYITHTFKVFKFDSSWSSLD